MAIGKKRGPKAVEPREMVIYSYQKVGKTRALLALPNALLVDFEDGSAFYDAESVEEVNSILDFKNLKTEFIKEAKEGRKPHFKFIILDTLTSMFQKIINALAVEAYNKEEGKAKDYRTFDIESLGYGQGHVYKRKALEQVKDFFKKFCDTLIMTGHIADKATGTDADELSVKDLDLPGKSKSLLAIGVDAICRFYRKDGTNENWITFAEGLLGSSGTRPEYLRGKEFKVSEVLEDGTFKTYWEDVFPSIKEK